MTAKRETEIKLRVLSPATLKRRLFELGFRPVKPRRFESNHLFDFANQKLRRARCLLRVRFAAGRILLTFKGPPLRSPDYKIRAEYETEVGDGRSLLEIFEALGLREKFCYEKYRTVYAPKPNDREPGGARLTLGSRAELVYDETPIGNYVELEGPKRWIDWVATQLGYDRRDYITASYVRLYYQECEKRRKKPANMVFRKQSRR